jgi:Zn-finger protein
MEEGFAGYKTVLRKPVAKQEAKRLQNGKQKHNCEFYPCLQNQKMVLFVVKT